MTPPAPSSSDGLDAERRAEAACLAHRAGVVAYAARHLPAVLRGHVDPQDVWQDVCLAVFRRAAELDLSDPDATRRLLLTIARNHLIDLARTAGSLRAGGGRARVEDLAAADRTGDALVPLLEQVAVYGRTPSQSAVAHEVAAMVHRSLARLSPDHAACVRLRYIEQRSVAEAAVALGRSPEAVQVLCHRALRRLRAELLRPAATP